MRERPLSPHLSIYRFRYTLTSSILNRFTGAVASVAFLAFAIWLAAAAGQSSAFERLHEAFSHPAGRVLLALVIVAFIYHTLAGIRHLIWDTGRALERAQSQSSAWLLFIATVVISAAVLYAVFFRTAGAP
jgi:succinate dehydrogenase / fumarate reductase, cytochrome b subunit